MLEASNEFVMKLFYLLLGATPKGRNTEQHDVFFGIAEHLNDLVPFISEFWPEAQGKIHLDGFKEVRFVDGFELEIVEKSQIDGGNHLFFINLGGYKKGYFTEFHEQHLMVGKSLAEVVKRAKKTYFYREMGFPSAVSHIDDKHGVDIDDVLKVNDILPRQMKDKYSINLKKSNAVHQENPFEIGYFPIHKL